MKTRSSSGNDPPEARFTLESLPFARRLLNLPIQWKLYCILGTLVVNLAVVIGLAAFGMSVLSSLRAYVAGEGLWAKSQKGAVLSLHQYALTRDEAYYKMFLDHLKIPLGDRRARLELEKPAPDLNAVDAGFVEGGNHPRDVRAMARLFQRFGRFRYIATAIKIWREADAKIVILQEAAEGLHRAVSTSRAIQEESVDLHLRNIAAIDRDLTALENEFSYTLGEASRWAKRVLVGVMLLGSALLGAASLCVALLISRAVAAGVREVAHAAGRAAQGDLSVHVRIVSDDELGRLASAFNGMVDGLSKIEQLKNDFVATVSHELRTPLTLTLAPLESLLAGEFGPLGDQSKKAIAVAHNNAVRLLQMVNGLLDFSKLEAGKVEAHREPLDLVELTQAVVKDFCPLAKKKRLALELGLEVPEIWVQMDRYLYERVLFNLLSNAIKFTPAGGRIDVRLSMTGNRLNLVVKDTGIGIDKADQTRLFEKFRQVESSSTRRFEGTGLGLALVKEFVGLLDGTVNVESEPSQGSVFTAECLAPRCGKSDAPTTMARPRSLVPVPVDAAWDIDTGACDSARGESPRVLIAEDNPDMAEYLMRLLRDLCEVRVASDGRQALDIVREWSPILVVADVMMPEKDGLSLCREVKSDPALASTPVVLLTALTDREAMMRGWEAGADEYLFKPFHPREVITRVRTLLDSIRARRAAESALAAKTRELQRSNAELEQFAFVASHDLREPLRKIVAFSEILLTRASSQIDDPSRDALMRMKSASHRMQTLIDDLLKYSRAGRRNGPVRPTNVRAAFDQAIVNLETAVQETGARVTCGELPTVYADSIELVQLFQNLIGNAIKFRSVAPPEVRVAAERRDGEWQFSVRDNGIGLDMRHSDRIFSAFERLHSSFEYPGSGIGLAVCKKIVGGLGGRIWVESEPGNGAAFFFTLPAKG